MFANGRPADIRGRSLFPPHWQSCYNYLVNESAGDRAASHLRFAPFPPYGARFERTRPSPSDAIR